MKKIIDIKNGYRESLRKHNKSESEIAHAYPESVNGCFKPFKDYDDVLAQI